MGDTPEAPPAPTREEERTPRSAPEEDWATQYKYLLADFENYRKRVDREREGAQTRIRGALLKGLLPIYEGFERARELAGGPGVEPNGLKRGLDLLEAEWQRLLQQEGVSPVATVGSPFAPQEEEAVAEVGANAERPDGVVAEIVQQGYRFRGGLLRPAKVVVARAAPSVAAPEISAGDEPPGPGEAP